MGDGKSNKSNENETRNALGDITNQLGKRKLSLITRSPPKTKSGNSKLSDDTDSDANFWKQVALVVEKLEKETSKLPKCPKIGNEVGLSSLKGGKTYLLNPLSDSKKGLLNVAHKTKEPSSYALDCIDLDAVNVGETVRKSCVLGVKVGESSNCCERERVDGEKEGQGEETIEISDVAENNSTPEVLGTQLVSDNDRNIGVDCMANSKSDSIVNSRLVDPQEMQGFGLERCTLLKRDVGSSFAAGLDSIKQCSCSFCSKAAFIWSDLHYQDVKGRISSLAKSQKESSNLAQKYYAEMERSRHAQGNFTYAAQLETDLMNQWRSLFAHMEDVYGAEGNQLQNNFLALKDIRDDFKMNLEINGMPLDVLQSSSDASDHTAS